MTTIEADTIIATIAFAACGCCAVLVFIAATVAKLIDRLAEYLDKL